MSPSNKKKHGKPKAAKATATSPPKDINSANTDSNHSSLPPIDDTHTSFSTFIQHADIDAIALFLNTADSSPQGSNLRPLWDRAFKEGLWVGQQLYGETKQKLDQARDDGYDEGYRDGRQDQIWVSENDNDSGSRSPDIIRQDFAAQTDTLPHVDFGSSTDPITVREPPPLEPSLPTVSIATQTEPSTHVNISTSTDTVVAHESLVTHLPQPTPPNTSIAIQTQPTITEAPPQIHLDLQTHSENESPPTSSEHLDWAEDASPLPITPNPSRLLPLPPPSLLRPPRNLSSLCTSSQKPFASLQRRQRQQRPRTYHKFNKDRFSCLHSPFFHHSCNQTSRFQPHPPNPHLSRFSTSSSTLDWETDPRLSDLSQALKALGWVRPEPATRTSPR